NNKDNSTNATPGYACQSPCTYEESLKDHKELLRGQKSYERVSSCDS
ncbi:unnamed protein product, partial [Urochloa humidicola]